MVEEKKKKSKLKQMKKYRCFIKYFFLRKYYQIKQLNIKDLIFIDRKVTLIFLVIIFLNVGMNYHEVGLPQKFPNLEDCISTVEILLRSIVVLLSIIFSFTLLSFQIFNKYFGRFAFYDFFKKSHLKVMFTLFILNVSFLIYTINYLKSCQIDNYFRSYGKLLFVESVVFSIILTISIFPVMINLLSHSQSRVNLKNLFNSFDDNSVLSFQSFFDAEIDEDEYETNSFKIITEISLVAIKDFDQSSLEIILRSIYLKVKEISNGEKSNELKAQYYYKFREVLRDLFSFAVKEKNNFAMSNIITSRLGIEKEIIKGNFVLDYQETYRGWDFNFDIEDFYSKTIQYNEDSISSRIIDSYRDYFREVIRIKFPDTFIYDFERSYQYSVETNIVSTNYGVVENFIKTAGEYKKRAVFKNLCNLFQTLDIEIVGSNHHVDTRNYLLQVNNMNKEKYLATLIEDLQIKNIEFQHYPYGIANTSEIQKMNSFVILRSQLKSIDYFFQKNVLNNLILNDLKAIAFSIINNFEDNKVLNAKLLKLIFNKFDEIRRLIRDNDTNERKDVYIKLERYLGYIANGYHEKVNNEELNESLKEIKSKFTNLERFKNDLKDQGYIQNNNLF